MCYDQAKPETHGFVELDTQQKDAITEEQIKTFYFKANLDMDITDAVRLRGNAGVQYIRTEQTSQGVYFDPTGMHIGSAGASYGDILPSLNLVLDFGNGWNVRYGMAKELMRPRINDMGAYASVGLSDGSTGPRVWSGSGGNPSLEPYRANAIDLSIEKYFGVASYVALAGFYKNLDSYVYTRNIPWDFSGYDYTGARRVEFGRILHTGQRHRRLHAWRRSQHRTRWRPDQSGAGWLRPAGERLYTESSIDPDGPDQGSSTDTFPGLSKIVANATVYYEKHGFSARVSQRYRDKYRGEYSSLFGQRVYRYTLSERHGRPATGLRLPGIQAGLVVAAASFMYIALSDLLPEMMRRKSLAKSVPEVLLVLAGVVIAAVVMGGLHSHAH